MKGAPCWNPAKAGCGAFVQPVSSGEAMTTARSSEGCSRLEIQSSRTCKAFCGHTAGPCLGGNASVTCITGEQPAQTGPLRYTEQRHCWSGTGIILLAERVYEAAKQANPARGEKRPNTQLETY